jgi:energy-coupling factor transport system permease protein
MQDPRLRLLATISLSGAAAASLPGAVIAIAWWLVWTPRRSIALGRGFLIAFLFVAVTAGIVGITGGSGISYLVRFTAVLLVAAWACAAYRPGELLDIGVWLFGTGVGFDLGLTGEMAMRSLFLSADDLRRIVAAQRFKGRSWNWRTFGPGLAVLVHLALRRADEQAEILALRGYRGGGTCVPHFSRGRWDLFAAAWAVLALGTSLASTGIVP